MLYLKSKNLHLIRPFGQGVEDSRKHNWSLQHTFRWGWGTIPTSSTWMVVMVVSFRCTILAMEFPWKVCRCILFSENCQKTFRTACDFTRGNLRETRGKMREFIAAIYSTLYYFWRFHLPGISQWQEIPSRELTHPLIRHIWSWFSFSPGGIC